MVLDFYYVAGSAPCRAVLMTAKAVGVDLNLKPINLMAGEHMKPEFIAVSTFEIDFFLFLLFSCLASQISLISKDTEKENGWHNATPN